MRKISLVKILAWIEVIMGVLGTLPFLYLISSFINGVLRHFHFFKLIENESSVLGLVFGGILSIPFLPFLFLFIGGLGALRLKTWAIKVNLFFVPISCVLGFVLVNYIRRIGDLFWLLAGALFFSVVFFLIWVSIYPELKKQFKLQG